MSQSTPHWPQVYMCFSIDPCGGGSYRYRYVCRYRRGELQFMIWRKGSSTWWYISLTSVAAPRLDSPECQKILCTSSCSIIASEGEKVKCRRWGMNCKYCRYLTIGREVLISLGAASEGLLTSGPVRTSDLPICFLIRLDRCPPQVLPGGPGLCNQTIPRFFFFLLFLFYFHGEFIENEKKVYKKLK